MRVPAAPTGTLRGRLVNLHDTPAARVHLERDGWQRWRSDRPGLNGRFSFGALAPGTYRLWITAGRERKGFGPFQVSGTAPIDIGEVTLTGR